MRGLLLLTAWTLLGVVYGPARSATVSPRAVSSTAELRDALMSPSVDMVWVNNTLDINKAEWGATLAINRSVTVSVTPERLATSTYVRVNFNEASMLFQLLPGTTLTFIGLELVRAMGTIGPSYLILRQSINSTFVVNRCIQRRWVGLPYIGSLTNQLLAARPPGSPPKPQNVTLVNATVVYNTTGDGAPQRFTGGILQYDFSTVQPPDNSLASQGLYYGGYAFVSINTTYVADHTVDQACLARRAGAECISLMRAALEIPAPPPPHSASAQPPPSGGPPLAVIVPIVVVLPAVLLLAVLLAALWWRRRRKAHAQARGQALGAKGGPQGDEEQRAALGRSGGGSGGGGGAGAGKGGRLVPGAMRGVVGYGECGCVFVGLEEGQEPPEWSEVLTQEANDELEPLHKGGSPGQLAEAAPASPAVLPGEDAGGPHVPYASDQEAAGYAGLRGSGGAGGGSPVAATNCVAAASGGAADGAEEGSVARVKGLDVRQGAGAGAGESPQAAADDSTSAAAAAGAAGAAPHSSDVGSEMLASSMEAAGPQGAGGEAGATGSMGKGTEGKGTAGKGTAGKGTAGKGTAGKGTGLGAPLQPRGPPSEGPAVARELEQLARRLRGSVGDVTLRLEAVIGSGAFGTVFKGTWQGLSVAVKTVVFSATNDRKRRALQEAALCQAVSHPNIVATYFCDMECIGSVLSPAPPTAAGSGSGSRGGEGAAGQQGDSGSGSGPRALGPGGAPCIQDWRLYMVQEYCDGGPLRSLYGNRAIWGVYGTVDMPAVLSLALGVSCALSHLHAKRVVHGDLNPNNVLLARDTGSPCGWAAKVADFGLSFMLPDQRTHVSNLRMGTMFYMCPAVILKAQVGPPADIFSLGVLLWELWHGCTAGVATPSGPRYRPAFPAFPPACPPAYRALAHHCLQREPSNRPTAEQVVACLEGMLAAL